MWRGSEVQGEFVMAKQPTNPRDWKPARLGDVIVSSESTYSPKEAWQFVNYLETGAITENRISAMQHIDLNESELPDRAKRKVKPGEIVFSTVRPVQRHYGLIRDTPENFLASTGFYVFEGREGFADTNFIYWYLTQKHIIEYLQTVAEHNTSAYPSIRSSDIQELKCLLPPLSVQHEIASVLDVLDNKIESNQRMNETLEAMAQAIFRDWFVDFGPTRAKMEGREPYLAPDIWNLFPDKLDNEGKPLGWGTGTISDFAEIRGGKQLTKDRFIEGGSVPVFGGAGLMGHTDNYNADGFIISFGRVGAYCGQFISHQGKAWINNNASRVLPRDGVSGQWLLLALKSLDIELIKKGAAQPFVANSDVGAMKILSPNKGLTNAFAHCVEPVAALCGGNLRENTELVQARDMLLPKLMSGEIRSVGEVV